MSIARKNSLRRRFELVPGRILTLENWTMNRREFIDKISGLRVNAPITTSFERAIERRGVPDRSTYSSQKEHWLRWLGEYKGPGYYRGKTWPQSAKTIYNRIVCPPMLLWLAGASGVPRNKLTKARQAALGGLTTFSARAAAIRNIIPWEDIEMRMQKHGAQA